jgi:glycosyltransferase 2 family protein
MILSSPHSAKSASVPVFWREHGVLFAMFALLAVGMLGAIRATGWHELVAQLSVITWKSFLVLLAFSLVNYGFRALRWHFMATRLGLPTTLLQNFRHYLGGFAMTITPGRVGELVRMRWIMRETGWAFERTAPMALVDRASDLAAMAALMGVAVAATLGTLNTGLGAAIPVTILAIVVAYIATRPSLLAAIAHHGYRLIGLKPRIFAKLDRAAKALARFSSPRILATASLIALIGWSAEGYAFHLLLNWLGADIGLAKAVAIFTFATLAGGLTGAPGGVGGAEAAMVALLSIEGVPLEISVPATAIIRVTTLWFAILIGLAIFPFAERISKKKIT